MDVFIIGFLSAIVIVFIIAIVVGMFMLFSLKKKYLELKEYAETAINDSVAREFERQTSEIHGEIENHTRSLLGDIDNLNRNLTSYIDSRIDKCLNK